MIAAKIIITIQPILRIKARLPSVAA